MNSRALLLCTSLGTGFAFATVFGLLGSPEAYAASALGIGTLKIATPTALYTGTQCYSASMKINDVGPDSNGGTMRCATWRVDPAPPDDIPGGVPMPYFHADGLDLDDCRWLGMTFAGTAGQFSTMDLECRAPGNRGRVFGDGFDGGRS